MVTIGLPSITPLFIPTSKLSKVLAPTSPPHIPKHKYRRASAVSTMAEVTQQSLDQPTTFLPLSPVNHSPSQSISATPALPPSIEDELPSLEPARLSPGEQTPTSPLGQTMTAPAEKAAQIEQSSTAAAIDEKLAALMPQHVNVPESAATRLKRMVEDTDDLIVCPGVYDGLSARIALQVGFQAMYMTGAGTTASRLGMADLGIAQLHDMREHAEMIANLDPFGAPLIADMDTGYGGPIMVANSVQQYIRAGVAGFHIEDQIQNKRCGHLAGKKVVSREEYYMRIRAAKAAKDRLRSDIVLIARTDANQMYGFDECVARLKVARELGADVGLLEGFKSKEEAARAVEIFKGWPLLLNSVENGASPLITVDEAKQMGFRIMIFSFASLAPAYTAIRNTFLRLKNEGVVGTAKDLTPKALFDVCGLKQSMEVDSSAGNDAFNIV